MDIFVNWTQLKEQIDNKSLKLQYFDNDDRYELIVIDGGLNLVCSLNKKKNAADVTDFETNYKTTSNDKIASPPSPFTDKKIDGKSLFSRVHGKKFTLSSGSNTVEYSISYTQVKFNEIEILGAELGDKVNLKILDDASGTYTTVPNYQLNQFGYDVYVAKDYYVRASSYDADLYSGMRIVVEYTSGSAKDIYINYILHELK